MAFGLWLTACSLQLEAFTAHCLLPSLYNYHTKPNVKWTYTTFALVCLSIIEVLLPVKRFIKFEVTIKYTITSGQQRSNDSFHTGIYRPVLTASLLVPPALSLPETRYQQGFHCTEGFGNSLSACILPVHQKHIIITRKWWPEFCKNMHIIQPGHPS